MSFIGHDGLVHSGNSATLSGSATHLVLVMYQYLLNLTLYAENKPLNR